jgi:hypothetical protein
MKVEERFLASLGMTTDSLATDSFELGRDYAGPIYRAPIQYDTFFPGRSVLPKAVSC